MLPWEQPNLLAASEWYQCLSFHDINYGDLQMTLEVQQRSESSCWIYQWVMLKQLKTETGFLLELQLLLVVTAFWSSLRSQKQGTVLAKTPAFAISGSFCHISHPAVDGSVYVRNLLMTLITGLCLWHECLLHHCAAAHFLLPTPAMPILSNIFGIMN